MDPEQRILQIGVKMLVRNKEGKILLMKRSGEKYPMLKDTWDIPGGRIIPGTPLMENLSREISEETGLRVVGRPKLISAQDIFFEDKHVVRLTFMGDADGEITLDGKEHTEYVWVSWDEMRRMKGLDKYLMSLVNERLQ